MSEDACFDAFAGRLDAWLGAIPEDTVSDLERLLGEQVRLCSMADKEVSWIQISYLRSSVLNDLPWFRIDFCDDRKWSDLDARAVDWDIPEIRSMIQMCWTKEKPYKTRREERQAVLEQERYVVACAEHCFSCLGKPLLRALCVTKHHYDTVHFKIHIGFGDYLGLQLTGLAWL